MKKKFITIILFFASIFLLFFVTEKAYAECVNIDTAAPPPNNIATVCTDDFGAIISYTCTNGEMITPPCQSAACASGGPPDIQPPLDTCVTNPELCAGPTSTPAPTGVPACGTSCVRDSDCASSSNLACPVCDLNSKVCVARPTATPQPTATPRPTATPTPIPACGTTCRIPADCQAARDGCTFCPPGGGVCSVVPTATPTPTPAPGCNVACPNDQFCKTAPDGCTSCIGGVCKVPQCGTACTGRADCQNAKDSCTACTNGVCSVPACGTACDTRADCAGAKDSCTACVNHTCQPPFNTEACKCDTVESSPLASGETVTVTAFAKVEGQDIQRAQIVSQKFTLYKGAETTATRILSATIPATVVESSSTLVRYKSVWTFTMPQLENGATYRIGVVADDADTCQPKTGAFTYNTSVRTNVLGTNTQAPGYCSWPLIGFFASVAGLCNNSAPVTMTTQSSDTPTPVNPNSKDSLQLKTFIPVTIYQKTCDYIKFRVGVQ